jgi:hypothetical protein
MTKAGSMISHNRRQLNVRQIPVPPYATTWGRFLRSMM